MVFLKPIDDLKIEDIERLKTNKICESQILDYKEGIIEDHKLVKQISAFANTQGGFLIFGVKETGQGGYPEEISGIEHKEINTERLEQIVLSNTEPRISIKLREIQIPETTKSLLIIEIPNSYLKPHMSAIDKKFYKRFQNQTVAMTEMEVNDAYRRKFNGYQQVENQISELLGLYTAGDIVLGQIIVIPTVEARIFDTSNLEDFSWMDEIVLEPKYQRYPLLNRTPSPNGIKCQDGEGPNFQKLEIHRNGCVHYASTRFSDYYGYGEVRQPLFLSWTYCIKLLQTLHFTSVLHRKFNYFGDVKIVCNLQSLDNTYLLESNKIGIHYLNGPCQTDKLTISREVSSLLLDAQRDYISSGIMNEVHNSYGEWKCPFFDEKGKFKGP
jgi:hypothetical protein